MNGSALYHRVGSTDRIKGQGENQGTRLLDEQAGAFGFVGEALWRAGGEPSNGASIGTEGKVEIAVGKRGVWRDIANSSRIAARQRIIIEQIDLVE